MFSLVSTFLLFVYVGNAISNYYWKANLNFNLISRMLAHYYHLYPTYTALLLITVPGILFVVVLMLYRKLFISTSNKEHKPARTVLCYLSLSFIIFIQLSVLNIDRVRKNVAEYFVGEMFVDLISEYTDPHLDYINDAGTILDEVSQSLNYIPQLSQTIDRKKKNIVLVIVDCLRADRLHSYGYYRNTTPFINKLIKENSSQQVEHAFSLCDESKCGIRSILTSRSMKYHNSRQASEYSLHKKLRDQGYQINFILSSDHAFGGLKRAYSPYDFYIDGLGFDKYPLNDDRGLVSVLEKWPDYNGSPNFFQFHLFSAHEAGISYGKYLGKGVHGIEPGFLQGESIEAKFSSVSPTSEQAVQDQMDNGVYQVDLIFSRLYTQLEQKGYLDNTLIIITGDHGQGLNEHGYYGHISGLYNESLRVPLIIIDTAGDELALAENRYANQHDIAPTIVKLVGIPVEPSWEGLALQTEKSKVTITTHRIPDRSSSYAKTLFNPADESLYKYIFLSTFNGLKEQRFLFELKNDPLERVNLLEQVGHQDKWINFASKWQLDSLVE